MAESVACEDILQLLEDFKSSSISLERKHAKNLLLQHQQLCDVVCQTIYEKYADQQIMENLCQELLALYYRGGGSKCLCIQTLPSAVGTYLLAIGQGFRKHCAHLETFLLSIYNNEVAKQVANEGNIEEIRLAPLINPSIYHKDPSSLLSGTTFVENVTNRSRSTNQPVVVKIGPYPSCVTINVENRFLILTRLWKLFNAYLNYINPSMLVLSCKICTNLCNSGFEFSTPNSDVASSITSPTYYNNFLLHVKKVVISPSKSFKKKKSAKKSYNVAENSLVQSHNVNSNSTTSTNANQQNGVVDDEEEKNEFDERRKFPVARVNLHPSFLLEMLNSVYFTVYTLGGDSNLIESLKALDSLHRRASYELYDQVILATNAIIDNLSDRKTSSYFSSQTAVALSTTAAAATTAATSSATTSISSAFRRPSSATASSAATTTTASSSSATATDFSTAVFPPAVSATIVGGVDATSQSSSSATNLEIVADPVASTAATGVGDDRRRRGLVTNASLRIKKLPDDIPLRPSSAMTSSSASRLAGIGGTSNEKLTIGGGATSSSLYYSNFDQSDLLTTSNNNEQIMACGGGRKKSSASGSRSPVPLARLTEDDEKISSPIGDNRQSSSRYDYTLSAAAAPSLAASNISANQNRTSVPPSSSSVAPPTTTSHQQRHAYQHHHSSANVVTIPTTTSGIGGGVRPSLSAVCIQDLEKQHQAAQSYAVCLQDIKILDKKRPSIVDKNYNGGDKCDSRKGSDGSDQVKLGKNGSLSPSQFNDYFTTTGADSARRPTTSSASIDDFIDESDDSNNVSIDFRLKTPPIIVSQRSPMRKNSAADVKDAAIKVNTAAAAAPPANSGSGSTSVRTNTVTFATVVTLENGSAPRTVIASQPFSAAAAVTVKPRRPLVTTMASVVGTLDDGDEEQKTEKHF